MSLHRKPPTSQTACNSLPDIARQGETPGFLRRFLGLLLKIREQQSRARRLRKSQRDARDAFMRSLRLDDKILDDIGVTREEVEWAARLPLEVNASSALYATARARRQGSGSRQRRASWSQESSWRGSSIRHRVIAPRLPLLHPHRAPPCRF